jgi:hypothetical protein
MSETRRDGSPVLEIVVERYLERQMKKIGGRAYKFAPTERGNPDRIVVFPFGRIYFVELKRKGKKPEPAQRLWHVRAAEMGHVVHVLDSREMVEDFITWGMSQTVQVLQGPRIQEEINAVARRYKEEA